MSRLQLRLLGEFRATVPTGRLDNFPTDKVRALLAYLALEGDRAHTRSHLAALLWGEWDETAARANLRKSLFRLRQTLGEAADDLLSITRSSVEFHLAHAKIDAVDFLKMVRADDPATLARAAELYQGTLLAGLSLADAPAFEEWLTVRREGVHQGALALFNRLAELHLTRDDFGAAQATALRQLALEPWHEPAHRQLMRAYAAAGQRTQALAQFEQCRAILAEELGIEPAAATAELAAAIAGEAGPAGQLHHFPTSHTPFIGRRHDVERLILRLQDPHARLVTIAGPGGIGKTRLASEAARQAVKQGAVPNAYFVPLRAAATKNEVWQALAEVLGVEPGPQGLTTREIVTFLRDEVSLLVLDNYEQLLPQTEVVTELLRGAEQCRIIVTSRLPLNLKAEWRLPLRSLSVPAAEVADPAAYASVQLLLSAAQQVQPELGLTPTNRAEIVRICQLLAGVPLALEMAGSWLAIFPPRQLADRLAHNLDFLVDTRKDVPARHRSLRAIFDHSLEQLTAAQRDLLGQLSCFQASFTLPAALTVTTMDLITFNIFIDHALLQRRTDDRYSLHPLLRAFIQSDVPVAEATQARHAHYYLHEVAATGALPLVETVAAVGADLANVQTAWAWALAQAATDLLAAGLAGLLAYYEFRGAYLAGHDQFAETAAKVTDSSLKERLHLAQAKCLRQLGDLEAATALAAQVLASAHSENRLAALIDLASIYTRTGRYDEAEASLAEAEPLAAPNSAEAARIWRIFGTIYSYRGTVEQRVLAHTKALEINMARDDELEAANCHSQLATLYTNAGDYETAIQHANQALALATKLDHQEGIARFNHGLGFIYWRRNDLDKAEPYYERSLALSRELGLKQGITIGLGSLGVLAKRRKQFSRALSYYEQAVALALELGDRSSQAVYLGNIGNTYRDLGDYEAAISYLERAAALDEASGAPAAVGRHLGNIADVYMVQERYAEARPFFARALPLLQQHHVNYFLCWVQVAYAECLFQLGELEEAQVLNEAGGRLAREVGREEYQRRSEQLAQKLA